MTDDTRPAGEPAEETAADPAGRSGPRRASAGTRIHTEQVATNVSPELRDALWRFADKEGLSVSEVIRRALDAYLS